MKTTALRLYGASDLRLETFELPEIQPDEVLMHVICDTVCASTYKAVTLGTEHKRVPSDIAENPIVTGHEMCGEIVKVGSNLTNEWKEGQRVVIQPALKLENGYDPGYSYRYVGGNMTYAVVPKVVLDRQCLVPFNADSFSKGSLVESIGCVLRAYKGMYHTDDSTYIRTDGAKKGGRMAILAGAGPMGLAAIDLAIHYAGVSQLVVTDLKEERLQYAASRYSVEMAKKCGVELIYCNTSGIEDVSAHLRSYFGGFDDVMVMAAVPALFKMAEEILDTDGCLNLFAGSPDKNLIGSINLYRVHYDGIHVMGTAGSIAEDTIETIELIQNGTLQPGGMISHIMGLPAAKDAIMDIHKAEGAKKVCYNDIDIPMVAVDDFEEKGKTDPLFAELHRLVEKNGGLWGKEAEEYLLANAPKLQPEKYEL